MNSVCELSECISQGKASKRIATTAVYQQVELGNFPDVGQMLGYDRERVISYLHFLVFAIPSKIADYP
jgi:hypothetical protein